MAAEVAATEMMVAEMEIVEMDTVEREWRPWNEGSFCAEIHG
jgi:hypothetical protein